MNNSSPQLAPGWRLYGRDPALQSPFDVAVVMPTVGRDCILEAVSSVYAQENAGRIQLLIGVDVPLGDFTRLHELLEAAPRHVTPCLFYPGFSTSERHGGLHPARDGGMLRTTLSYLANARYIAYLDDDNWWSPNHLGSMLYAIQGREWAFALRWFVHPESRQPVCVDDWESVGPGRGVFVQKFGGWVDPNCLMIDKLACEPVLRWWGIPLPGDMSAMSADRHVYGWLQKKSAPGETHLTSVYYAMQPEDGIHPSRLNRMGSRYDLAAHPIRPAIARLTAIVTCKNRLHHLKQTLPFLIAQPSIDVIVVDYGCPQGTAAWVNEHYPGVRVVEVRDDPGFSVARARNMGAQSAITPWLLFIDADIIVNEGFGAWLKSGLKPDGFHITPSFGSTDVSGTFFCPRLFFEGVGGYDEAIRGWGGEDDDLYLRLLQAGHKLWNYPDALFSTISHGEDERFSFYPGTNRNMQMMLNHWYTCMKYDLMAASGRSLSMEERTSLRKVASEAAQQALNKEKFNHTETFMELGERTELTRSMDWKLERKLIYKLSDRTASDK